MKTMREWEIRGLVTLDVIVTVEAETLEEAIEIAEGDVSLEEYCGAQVGLDYGYADEVTEADLRDGGMDIEWHKEWCQQTGEFEVDDDDEEDEDDE